MTTFKIKEDQFENEIRRTFGSLKHGKCVDYQSNQALCTVVPMD